MSDCSTEAFKPHARMTKSKSQLRAEAVERLRKLNCMDVDCYQLLEATVDDAGEKVGYRVEIKKLIDLLTDDAQEARGSYEERLHDVPVSDCPYCGCKRVVIHDFSEIYENPHSYRVEHVDEKEAFEAGCFETYYSFDSAEKAVEHANMRDPLTDEPMDARRDSDGTCPDGDGTVSNHSKNAPTLSDLYGILGGENVQETPDFAENPQKTEFKERESAPSDELPEGDAVAIMRKVATCGECTGYTMRKEVGGIDWADALLILADMVERDYVSREVYEDLREEFTWETTFLHRMGKKCGTKNVPSLVAYVDKLEARVEELEAVDRRIAETDSRWEAATRDLERMTAERDELKRQLGTVSAPSGNLDAQARAEIEDAERSRGVSGDAGQDVDVDSTENAIAAWNTRAEHERFLEEKFCELMQRLQFPLNEQREMLNSLRCGAVEAETSQVIEHTFQVTEHDTRAKLEADICAKLNDMARFSWRVDGIMKQAKGWLDRQAAITRAECDKPNWDYCETCEQLKAMQDKIAELKADNDYLRDRNEKLDYEVREWKGEAKTQRNNFEQATEARKHWQSKYENVKAERDEWKAKAEQAQESRDDLGSQPKNLGSEPSTLEDFEGKGFEADSREKLEEDAYTRQGDVPPSKTDRVGDAQTAQGCADDEIIYGFQFCDVPSSTMLGETVFDCNGEPVGWIVANGLKGDCGHDADISDSREGLEEDVRGYYDEHECDTLMRVDFLDAVYAWLDRQAAITRAECDKPNWDYCETCEQLKAMQDKIDTLEAALKGERNNFYQATESRKHWQREYENLKVASETYRDGMHAKARRVGEVKAERDAYRDKLGRAIDAAHEIARMVDES